MSFPYQALQGDEIRLVTIEPAGDDPTSIICCRLEHVSLGTAAKSAPESRFKGDSFFWPETREPLEIETIFKKGVKPEDHHAVEPTTTGTSESGNDEDLPWRFDWGDYAALSYSWGPPEPRRHILLNGNEFAVTPNLWDALFQLRRCQRIQQGFKLWIDAICINQGDVDERSHQVGRMRDIYALAWQVVVWLGPEADDSDLAMITLRWIASLVRANPSMTTFYREKKQIDVRPFFIKWATYESPLRKEVNKALFHLFTRRYWRRMWILQEVAMARADSPVLCGTRSLVWHDLYESAQYITQDEARLGRDIAHSIRLTAMPAWTFEFARGRDVYGRQWAPERMWELLVEMAKVQLKQKKPGGRGLAADLLKPLLLSREATITDEKDKVYGILGIREIAERVTIVPDYNLVIGEIYQDFAAKLIAGGDLNVLRLASSGTSIIHDEYRPEDVYVPSAINHRYITPIAGVLAGMFKSSDGITSIGTECTHGLPSWAICWACEPAPTAQLFGLYEAGGPPSSANVCFTADSSVTVKGVVIDKLSCLSSFNQAEVDKSYPMNAAQSGSSLYGDLEATRTALWRTIVADTTAEGGEKAPEMYSWLLDPRIWDQGVAGVFSNGFSLNQLMKRNKELVLCGHTLKELVFGPEKYPWWKKSMRKDQLYSPTKEECEALGWATNATAWRRLVGTEGGRMGLVPATAIAGDAVVILSGCSTPMILREFEDGWKIVGESYIHGVMYGELAGDAEMSDVKLY
ncbi:hypothetical protein ACO1O0_009411 [Amphichorda felina]